MSRTHGTLALCVLLLATGCGGDDVPAGGLDAGAPDAGAAVCAGDTTCDDGLFCNGAERCDPGAATADARGCVLGEPPCAGACAEGTGCASECADADGDGARDEACGGNDCDDSDAQRYPGNTEVCDAESRDEDCDPTTLGHDRDGDGFVDAACCNHQRSGRTLCGLDCDDTTADVRPGILDVCGNGDEDCDGVMDEDPNRVYYRDRDGDGYGTPDDTIVACAAAGSYVASDQDCDDTDRRRSPVADEVCDSEELDEDCDGLQNESCPCVTGSTRSCGTDVGACSPGTQTCVVDGSGGSRWGEVCAGAVEPSEDRCNLVDEDCDGDLREGFECLPGESETGVNACGRSGARACRSESCTWATQDYGTVETASSCDYCDDTGTGPAEGEAFATGTYAFSFERATPLLLGNAVHGSSFTTLVAHDSPAPRAGGAFAPDSVPLGYGGAVLDAAVASSPPAGATRPPGDGWALVAIVEPGTPALGPGDSGLGVPRDRDGFAVEWRRYEEGDPTTTTDSLILRRLSADGSDPVILRIPDPRPAGTQAPTPGQRLELTIAPDVPGTAADETSVTVRFQADDVWSAPHGCGGARPSCGLTLAAGIAMRFGITAAVAATRQETFYYRAAPDPDGGRPVPALRVERLCP